MLLMQFLFVGWGNRDGRVMESMVEGFAREAIQNKACGRPQRAWGEHRHRVKTLQPTIDTLSIFVIFWILPIET